MESFMLEIETPVSMAVWLVPEVAKTSLRSKLCVIRQYVSRKPSIISSINLFIEKNKISHYKSAIIRQSVRKA